VARDRPVGVVGRQVTLASIALLVGIRFFTDVVSLLPGMVKVVDIPLLGVLVVVALTRPVSTSSGKFFGVGLAFLGMVVLSLVCNLGRLAPWPSLLFVYGFLGPLVAYWATWRIWPAGNAASLTRLIVQLGVLQFVVVAFFDLPRFLSSGDPDKISGTFGDNGYQLVFFLLVFASVVASVATVEHGPLTARLAPLLLGASLLVIFLAQFRALLITTALTVALVGYLLAGGGAALRRRAHRTGFVFVFVFVTALTIVAIRFPTTKFLPYLTALRQDPTFFVTQRLHAIDGVLGMYDQLPATMIVGSGPGTFSSRAWETFAQLPSNRAGTDPVSQSVTRLTGGAHYETDVSEKYSLPQYSDASVVLGSRALSSPFSSYSSLLAEVGIMGCALLFGAYVAAAVMAARRAKAAVAAGATQLVPLLVAAAVGMVVLLQMALLANWLEVMRITMPAWMVLAVAMKEWQSTTDGP
jgi:hypothetical protein